MASVKQSILRAFEGLSHSRETRSDASSLLQNCPIQSGKATLVAGTVVVPCASILSTSIVMLTPQSAVTAAQSLYVSAISPGVSFTITDAAGTSTASVAYAVI